MSKKDHIIHIFEELSLIYDVLGEKYRSVAYSNAISSLQQYDLKEIMDRKVPGVGKSIHTDIVEIFKTGKTARLADLRKKYRVFKSFSQIPGFGPAAIKKLIAAGIVTIAQLKKVPNLTTAQKLGLKYHSDLEKSIPRKEVEELGKFVYKVAQTTTDDKLSFIIAGSYRRGKVSSGDVDLILYSKKYNKNLLKNLNATLKKAPNFVGVVASGQDILRIYYRFGGIVRKVDIFNTPIEDLPTFLLYSTGSAMFNQRLRLTLKKKGYKLSQNGLFKGDKKIPIKNEHEVFDIAGIPYLEPKCRNY